MARMSDGIFKLPAPAHAEPGWALVPVGATHEKRGIAPLKDTSDWAPSGPGWHDSSWLLRQGLEVTELRSAPLVEGLLRALQMRSPPAESVHHAPA